MGCVQTLEPDLIDSPSINKNNHHPQHHQHTRCETSEQPSESTPSFDNDNINKLPNDKHLVELHAPITQYSSENININGSYDNITNDVANNDNIPLQHTSDLMIKKYMIASSKSNSLSTPTKQHSFMLSASLSANTATNNSTLDSNVLSHINHNKVTTFENRIDEEEEADFDRDDQWHTLDHADTEEFHSEETFLNSSYIHTQNSNRDLVRDADRDLSNGIQMLSIQHSHSPIPVTPDQRMNIQVPSLEDNISHTLHLESNDDPSLFGEHITEIYEDLDEQLRFKGMSTPQQSAPMTSTKTVPRKRSPSTPTLSNAALALSKMKDRTRDKKPKNPVTNGPYGMFRRSRSHDPDKIEREERKRLRKSRAKKRSSSRTKHNHRALNRYAFNENGKINLNKNKKRLLHAKSKSIPQNLFSSSVSEHQNEEANTYNYLAQITHFDQTTLRLLHLRFDLIDTLSTFDSDPLSVEEEVGESVRDPVTNSVSMTNLKKAADPEIKRPNGKLNIDAIASILGLPSQCILVWFMSMNNTLHCKL